MKPIEPFLSEAPAVPLETDEVAAVRQLADAMSIEGFDLAAYADDYQDKLRQLVEAKVKGQEVVAAPAEPPPAAVENLMEALQRSPQQRRRSRPRGRRASRRSSRRRAWAWPT